MSGLGWLSFLIVGLIAGWIAEQIMKREHGLFINLVVGVIGAYLGAFRNLPPIDAEAFVQLVLRISEFVSGRPELREAEFNPVWVGPPGEGAWVLDALILTSPDVERR